MFLPFVLFLVAYILLVIGWVQSVREANGRFFDLRNDVAMLEMGREHRDRVIGEKHSQVEALKKKLNHAEARHAKLLSEHHLMRDHLRKLGSLDLAEVLPQSDKPIAQTPASVQA